MPLWSIIVLTTPRRFKTLFVKLVENLNDQAFGKSVEVLGLYDNKKQPIGTKRNSAVAASTGKYISFVDDDDEVSPKYVDSILAELIRNPGVDAVFFDVILRQTDNNREIYCTYSPDMPYDKATQVSKDGRESQKMLVPHIACWRRDFFEQVRFGNNIPEGIIWSQSSNSGLRKWSHIKTPLYYYNFCPSFSEWKLG